MKEVAATERLEDLYEDYDLLLEFDKEPKFVPLFNSEKPGALLNTI